ncbi:MAG: type II/IV secretion system ATPase subunit [Candidatus Altiarchaeota archaeon]|nr:type II/IV secretion system ATPase subunit [Candidatus Altiarchaeota archaeon]
MLGFSSAGSADLNFPIIGTSEEKILIRYAEIYGKNDLEELILAAKKKLQFDESAVRFWAQKLVEGNLGPLSALIEMDLEEIMVNSIDKRIYVYHRKKGVLETNLMINSAEYFLELSNRMLSFMNRRVNQANPRESAILANGDRLSVFIPPYASNHSLNIRKYAVSPFTPVDLYERDMMSLEDLAFLWMVMETGQVNVGFVGNTGSGKTTLLNALMRFIPENQRVVLIEEVPEIRPPQEQSVGLVSNKNLQISMRDAIIDSLRMRPDRVVIGEVRSDSEVSALRESCLAGHALGTYFTYHAESADWAYRRLMHQGFPEYDLSIIPLMIVCRRFEKNGKLYRRVVEIFGKTKLLKDKSFTLNFDSVSDEILRRVDFLESCTNLKDEDFFDKIQRWYSDIRQINEQTS